MAPSSTALAIVLLAALRGALATPFNFAYGFWSPFGTTAWHPDANAHPGPPGQQAHGPPPHLPHHEPAQHPHPTPEWPPHHGLPPTATPTSLPGSSYTVYNSYTDHGWTSWTSPTTTSEADISYGYYSATAINPFISGWTGFHPPTPTVWSTRFYYPTATASFPTGYTAHAFPPGNAPSVEPTPMTKRFEGPRRVKRAPQFWGPWQPQPDGPHGGPPHRHGHGHHHGPEPTDGFGGPWPTATAVWPTGGPYATGGLMPTGVEGGSPDTTSGWAFWSQPTGYECAPVWFPNPGPWPVTWEPAEGDGDDGDS